MIPALVRVEKVVAEIPGTVSLHLARNDGRPLPAAAPGQFNMLYAFGDGEAAISISGDSAEDEVAVHTIRSLGTVTTTLAALGEGAELGVRGPFGRGWPVDELAGRSLLIIAGGLGLAPLRPVIYGALRGSYGNSDATLLYGARQPADLLYQQQLARWSQDMRVEVTVDRADGEWAGDVGAVTALFAKLGPLPASTLALVCGPEIMMRFAIQELRKRDVAPESIFLSMERNMQCATGHCGHCQWGPYFVCRDGPVFSYGDAQRWLHVKQL